MENKINFKMLDGSNGVLSFNPAGDLTVSLESDTTPLKITVQSPTKKAEVDFIGGREKRG